LGPEDVLVSIEYSSISVGTERWCLRGKLREPGHPLMTPFPHVPGYQAAGVVVEVGEKVTEFTPGDRVFSYGTRLAAGWPGSCWGAHVRFHVANQGNVIRLPEAISTFEASGLVLAQVGYNGAQRPWLQPGDVALVIGDGLVGQYAAQVFHHRGAHVILSGHHPDRLALAARYSAEVVVNSTEVDLAALIRSRYPGGVQVAAETASKSETVRAAINLVQYDGQLVLLGYYPEGECLIDIHWIRARETTVHCPNGWTRARMEATLDLIEQGAMVVEELTTHTFPYQQAPEAYRMILERSPDFLGVVLRWTEGDDRR
jgi:2-desacetyl-2-hydroxyethyl bacteriochlorophyllide A dehydrogenase